MASVNNPFIYINAIAVLLSFPGISFIIVVNIQDLYRNRNLPLSDQLMFGFNLFSLLYGLHEEYILHNDLFPLPNNEYDKKKVYTHIYLNICTLWFSALLSIHFCLKIVNINHWFYIGLQRIFPKLFPSVIIAFPVGHFLMSLYSTLITDQDCLLNISSKYISIKKPPRCSWPLLISMTLCGLCAFFCSISALTILISLLKHMKRIQGNTENSTSPNMDAHIRATKTVTTLLATNILIFISVAVLTAIEESWGYVFGILISMCHIFNSYFLIKGTKKLDKTLAEVINHCLYVNRQKL